jgi:hypothetical protein
MLNAIGDSLSYLGCNDVKEDGEDEEPKEDIELGKVRDYDDPGCMMCKFSKKVEPCKVSFGQK